jgi:hypothetical protein
MVERRNREEEKWGKEVKMSGIVVNKIIVCTNTV